MFNFFHYLQYYLLSYQAIIISSLNISFDYPFYLPTLSYQTKNISNADDFAPNLCSCLLLYHSFYLYFLTQQAVNVSSFNKLIDYYSCFCFTLLSLSISSQTFISTDTFQNHNFCPCYFYNFCHHLDIADSLKIINQEILQPKNWISPIILNSQKEFIELPTINILIVSATPFNMLIQQASYTKNMKIFSI